MGDSEAPIWSTRNRASLAIAPLIQLLQRELQLANLEEPTMRDDSIVAFTHWYLDVVQRLEVHVAQSHDRQAITRGEVELMCRCAMSASDLRGAIELCCRYCAMLYPRAGALSVSESGGQVVVRLDSLRPTMSHASSLMDITGLFAFRQLFQWLVAVDVQLQKVCIGPIQRDDVLPFLQLFKAPVLVGGSVYSLHFASGVLGLPVVRSADEFDAFFAVFPCGVFEDSRENLAQQISVLLAAAARQGDGLPSQKILAAALGISLSTFRRRLHASDTSYRQLRESCLQQRAQHLLAREHMPVAAVASQLGFSDPKAFRRAFQRWYGMTPTRWRQSAGA